MKPYISRTVIVLDAGHGGKDPGSVGQSGLLEKTVTLAAAKQLQEILVKRGYTVIMTRDGDTYPKLEERIEVARAEDADLFLSIHADAATTPKVRGASVYTLSAKGERRLNQQLRDDGNFIVFNKNIGEKAKDDATKDIILDIASRETRSTSSKFANMVVEKLQTAVLMVNNTHREANYVVLLSPDVPAVLLELAFISNSEDEKNLNSVTWRRKTMVAVADSIDAYFGAEAPVLQALNGAGGQ